MRGVGERSTSGLGRGLSGILDNVGHQRPEGGVADLLGIGGPQRSPEVRRLVTELAVDAIATTLAADAVLIARRQADPSTGAAALISGPHPEHITLRSRVPSTWSSNDLIGFQVLGRLWHALHHGDDGAETHDLGGTTLAVRCVTVGDSVVATVILRRQPLDERERGRLDTVLRSLARATVATPSVPNDASVRVHTRQVPSGDDVLADVRIDGAHGRFESGARAVDAERAVAEAAVDLCRAPLEVRFAGATDLGDERVCIVVLGAEQGPLVGLAITDSLSATGIAEATFSAASVVGADPFSPRPH